MLDTGSGVRRSPSAVAAPQVMYIAGGRGGSSNATSKSSAIDIQYDESLFNLVSELEEAS